METEGMLPCSMASFVEDVLQQHGKSLSDIDLASRKAEEASLRRYEAAGWIRKMAGVVLGKDLPAEPSEEEFRLGLRSGIILCNVLNKVQPGAVIKVIEAPPDSGSIPDGAALSAYQYFENVRNFLVAVEEMGVPTFEASDLEKGGKSSRIVNCILALKSYNDWKLSGGSGVWKFGGNQKPSSSSVKQFVRKNTELFMNSISRNSLMSEKSTDSLSSEESACGDYGNSQARSLNLNMLVRELLLDKKQEDIPFIVENMLNKVMQEYEQRIACQKEQSNTTLNDTGIAESVTSPMQVAPQERNLETTLNDTGISESGKSPTQETPQERNWKPTLNDTGISESVKSPTQVAPQERNMERKVASKEVEARINGQVVRQKMMVEQNHRSIEKLKNILHSAKEDMHFLQTKHQEEVSNLGKHLSGLANAASGYHKVLQENRKLYNQVQDLKGNIRVYCRVRPFLPGQPNGLSNIAQLDEGNISIIVPLTNGKEGRKTFNFNKVFGPSATQEEVFADTQPLIRSVLDGYNVCIFAYGQTGAGKTYTMSGPDDLTEESMGVNYRALGDLFHISEQRKAIVSYDVSVQMIEIYNEQVRDLLVTDGLNKRLEIHNNSPNGINVPDANIVPVASTSDVINLMNLGHKNRAVSSTAMNDRSSRSHSCLTVHVQGRDLTSNKIIRGCMHLVDLAGSERIDKSEVVGDGLKEAQHINKSLSALGDVIASLAQKSSHVPYRNSKLTQLLQDALGGQAKTLMFVHISPDPDATGETISTLKFAERVSTVELGAARSNKESTEVRELKEQIATLKAALGKHDGETARLQHSKSSSSEKFKMKSFGSSSPSIGQSIDDMDNFEVMSNSTSKPKRRSLDPQDLNSPPWPPIGSPGSKDGERDALSSDWVDKVMLSKLDAMNGSKVHPDDDLDAATSDSSEADFHWKSSISRISSSPSELGSKIKKPSSKLAKTPDSRSSIPTPKPRRLSTGTPLPKTGRRPVSSDGKRKPGSGK